MKLSMDGVNLLEESNLYSELLRKLKIFHITKDNFTFCLYKLPSVARGSTIHQLCMASRVRRNVDGEANANLYVLERH